MTGESSVLPPGAPGADAGLADAAPGADAALADAAPADAALGEGAVADIWGSVLGHPDPSPDDNFFISGGDSLLAMRLVARIEQACGIRLPIKAVFEAPTIHQLARRLAEEASSSRATSQDTGPHQHNGPVLPAVPAPGPGAPAGHEGRWRASPKQERRILTMGETLSGPWIISACFRLRGALQPGRLERALAVVSARHPALRMSFHRDGGTVYQHVHPDIRIPLQRWKLAANGGMASADEAGNWARVQATAAFNATAAPLARACLAETGPREYLLVLAVAHIVCDGWSFQLILRDLSRAYAVGGTASLEPVGISPGEWAQAQWSFLASEAGARAVQYWRGHLGDDPSVLRFQLPGFMPVLDSSPAGAPVSVRVPADPASGLRRLAQARSVTVFAMAAAALGTWVAGATGQRRCTVLTASANRRTAADESLVEWVTHDLYLMLHVDERDTFAGLARQAQDAVAGGLAHGGLDDWYVHEQVWPYRQQDTEAPNLYLVVSKPWAAGLELAGVSAEPSLIEPGNRPGLWIWGVDSGDSLGLRFEYQAGSFPPGAVSAIADSITGFLAAGTAHPDRQLGALVTSRAR
jgi:acyl carrier protein